MDSRRYDTMVLEAQQRVDMILANFERQFNARRIQNAEKRDEMLNILQQVMAEPEPIPPADEGLELPTPEFEEDTDG